MSREIRINLIAKDDVSGRLEVISVNAQKTGETLNKAGSDGAKGMEQVSTAAERTTESLDRSAIAAGAFGATIMSALVVPMGMGAKAAWDQVDAVEQATLALRAYETDVRKVDKALADMLAFARTDEGRLFMRQELFAFAQQLRVAGVETERLAEYTQIASRSVMTGMGTWDELARVITRVGQTSQLTGIDFEMLQKMGFQLDQEIKNQAITWEELFAVLDKGSVSVAGASDTIRGQAMMTTTAIRSLGLAFLQVDSETSQFAEGGLGQLAYETFPRVREVIAAMIPVAEGAGRTLAFLGQGAAAVVDAFTSLPQWVQSGTVAIVAGFGAVVSSASLLLLTFNKVTAGAVALRAVFTGLAAHPVGLALTAIGVAVGFGISAWANHRAEVERADAAYASVGQTALEVQDVIANFKLSGGDLDFASQITEINSFTAVTLEAIQMVNEQRFDWDRILNINYKHGSNAASDEVRAFLDSVVGQAFMQWAADNDRLGPDIITMLMEGTGPELISLITEIQPLIDEFFGLFDVPPEMHQRVSSNTKQLIDYMMMPLVDSQQVMADWYEARNKFLSDPLSPDMAGYDAWLDQYLVDLPDVTAKANAATDATTRLSMAIGVLNDEAQGFTQTIMGLNTISDDDSFITKMLKALGTSAGDRAAISSVFDDITAVYKMYDDMPAPDAEHAEWVAWVNEVEQGTYVWRMRVAASNQALAEQSVALDDVNDGLEFQNTLMGQAIDATREEMLQRQELARIWAEHHQIVKENLNALIEVAGYGDPLSRWNLEGNATALSTLAMNANQAANGLDNIFRVVVGNTSAIGSQFEQLFKWADELIAEEGVLSKLDDLVNAGRITGESGVFDGMSEYALAQQAFNSIAEDNLRVQEAVLTIQAKQAPLIAEQANAYADLMDEISRLPAGQQMVTLGWMDSTTAMRAMEFQTLAVAAATGQLGKNGEEVFANIVIGAANADPILKAMLVDMGLISEGADGTITVNYDDVVDGKSEIQRLIESIDALTLALGGIPPTVTTEVELIDNASGPLASIQQTIANIDGTRAVTYVETIFSSQGQRTQQHGGTLPGYAMGGVLFRGAEIGPEIAHFAGGGTALLPRDGLYSMPAGTYISPNNAISNSYGGISIDFSGAVFNNTSREEMNAWAEEDLLPLIGRAAADKRVGMGAG